MFVEYLVWCPAWLCLFVRGLWSAPYSGMMSKSILRSHNIAHSGMVKSTTFWTMIIVTTTILMVLQLGSRWLQKIRKQSIGWNKSLYFDKLSLWLAFLPNFAFKRKCPLLRVLDPIFVWPCTHQLFNITIIPWGCDILIDAKIFLGCSVIQPRSRVYFLLCPFVQLVPQYNIEMTEMF